MKITFFLAMFIVLGFMAPDISRSQPTNQNEPKVQVAPASSDSNAEQVRLLEKEIQVQKEFTEHILTTVYFCLGTVIVVLLAMIGFGWYQNVKAYERDKEAMRQSLRQDIDGQMVEAVKRLEQASAEDFKKFDAKVADLFERTFQNFNDINLSLRAAIFRSTHSEKTPRTDFAAFLILIKHYLAKASTETVAHALSALLSHLENPKYKDSLKNRTELLALAEELPAEHAGAAQRLRELLAQSLEQ